MPRTVSFIERRRAISAYSPRACTVPVPTAAAARSVKSCAFTWESGLNVLYFEIVAEAFARDEFRVVHLGVELVDRHAFVVLVGRHQQVEVQGEPDRRLEDGDQGFAVDLGLGS